MHEVREDIDAPQKQSLKERLDKIKAGLANALLKAEVGDVQEAAKDYETARVDYEQIEADLKPTSMAADAATAPAAQAGEAASVPGPLDPAFLNLMKGGVGRNQRLTLEAVTRRLGWFDLIFTAIILLIAVGLGLQFLWVNNATWGGWSDYFTAVLWGLGLHQVSGSAFEGLEGLFAKSKPGVTS